MNLLTLLLLMLCCICQVVAQDQGNTTPLSGNTRPDHTAAATGTCPHCTPTEQLLVDLNYYNQVLNLLEQTAQQRNNIDAELLQSFHSVLVKTRPDLAPLFVTSPKLPARPVSPVRKVKKPVKRPVASVKKPPPKQGIEGLIVGHVNEENTESGIKASVVLVSHGRPRSLNLGGVIEHNQRAYKVLKIDYIEDWQKGNRHEVRLQEQTNKKIHLVPWK